MSHVLVIDAVTYEELETIYIGGAVACITTMPLITIQPPASVSIRQECNRFFNQNDWINILTWATPENGGSPVAYRIYRDEELTELMATISADSPLSFSDHRRTVGQISRYYLVSVSDSGAVSEPVNLEI